MHPVVEGRWPVSSLRCETVVMCVCVGTHSTLLPTHYCFFKQPTRNAESTVGQVCICGTPDQDQDYSYCILTDASCEGKVFPVLCRCGGAGSWHSSFLSTLSCRMNSVFPMPSCALSVFNVSCSLGAQWDLTGAFNLHPTDDRRVHTSVYTASADTFCKVFISSVHSFIRFPLVSFFIVMCEMMNPLWDL